MIKCDKEMVSFNGSGANLYAEVGCIMHTMISHGIVDAESLHELVDLSSMDVDRLCNEVRNELNELIKELYLQSVSDSEFSEQESLSRDKRVNEMLDVIKEVQRRKK